MTKRLKSQTCNVDKSPFGQKTSRFEFTAELIHSILDLTAHEWNSSLALLLYLVCNENVLLVESGDMYQLIHKLYSFTPKFHIERTNIALQEGSFIFTERTDTCVNLKSEELPYGRSKKRSRPYIQQYAHVFEKQEDNEPLENVVPQFRGVSNVPPNAQIFSDLAHYEHYASHY